MNDQPETLPIRRRPPRVLRLCKLVAVLGIAAFILWLAVPHPPDLLARATRVPRFSYSGYLGTDVGWLSNDEALLNLGFLANMPDIVRLNLRIGASSSVSFPSRPGSPFKSDMTGLRISPD